VCQLREAGDQGCVCSNEILHYEYWNHPVKRKYKDELSCVHRINKTETKGTFYNKCFSDEFYEFRKGSALCIVTDARLRGLLQAEKK
jgi:hypothetical protein